MFDRWQRASGADALPPSTGSTRDAAVIARWDRAYAEAEGELTNWFAPRLTALRLEGVDELGHAYLRDAAPELFGRAGRTDAEPSSLDRYFAYLDSQIASAIAQTEPGDLLLVVSGFGMERTPMAKRLLARLVGEPERAGSHEAAPDGFLIAYGTNVLPGEYRRGSVVDLAPTVLYYMGLPIGRDMDGFARTDMFRSTFTRDHPVTYTLTHER